MSTPDGILHQEPAVHGMERRGEKRHPIQQRCIVSLAGAGGPDGWHCIAYNISANGIGILLPLRVRSGAILRIEPWGLRGAPVVEARVVHSKILEFVWMCGCEFLTPLREEQLQAWLSGKTKLPKS